MLAVKDNEDIRSVFRLLIVSWKSFSQTDVTTVVTQGGTEISRRSENGGQEIRISSQKKRHFN